MIGSGAGRSDKASEIEPNRTLDERTIKRSIDQANGIMAPDERTDGPGDLKRRSMNGKGRSDRVNITGDCGRLSRIDVDRVGLATNGPGTRTLGSDKR